MQTGHQFRAFDTDIFLGIINQEGKLEALIDEVENSARDFERQFSRFDETSELSALNSSSGKKIKVSKKMIDLLTKAKEAYLKTQGIFDPTVLVSLKNIGYDKTFKDIQKSTLQVSTIKEKFKNRISFDNLKIDQKNQIIESPSGLSLDLGGIAKGYWVDETSKILNKHSENFFLSAGGDIFIKGKNEEQNSWTMGIQNPLELDSDIATLTLPKQGFGVATSGIVKRHGVNDNFSWHHIIDPRTGLPAKNSILSVTTIANSAMDADIMAKTILILGIKKGLALINSMRDYECIIIDKDLRIHSSKGTKKFL